MKFSMFLGCLHLMERVAASGDDALMTSVFVVLTIRLAWR